MSLSPDDIKDYLLDELPPDRRAETESRLRSDPAARAELDRQRAVLDAVRAVPQESVPRRTVFVRDPRAAAVPPGRHRIGFPARAALAGIAAALAIALGTWAIDPAIQRRDSGWILYIGAGDAVAEPWTEDRLRRVLRDELATAEARWRLALEEASGSMAGAAWVRSEFESVREDLNGMHEDAVAGYGFVNAKHELLRRQLLEFDLASGAGTVP